MDIKLQLSKDFERCLEDMKKKYGEDFEYINGVADSQLDYSSFLSNFVSNSTLADASIDPNANSHHRDIRSFMTEKGKSEDKLFGLNKIFLEIKRKYGLKTAKMWFEQEFSKGFYLNDSATASYFPYCYKGEELIVVKYNNEVMCVNFKGLYNILTEEEVYDESICQNVKRPNNLYVLDVVGGKEQYSKVLRVVRHQNEVPMRFIECSNGVSQIVTANHPVITTNGDIPAEQVTTKDRVVSVKPSYFTDSVDELCGIKLNSTTGWIAGMLLAEGYCSGGSIFICQNSDNNYHKEILSVLDELKVGYSIFEGRKIYIKKDNKNFFDFATNLLGNFKSQDKQLPRDFIHYNKDFLMGVVAGLIDGDGTKCKGSREWILRVTSETLIRQVESILGSFGIFARSYVPYQGKGIGKTHKTMYGTMFREFECDFFEKFNSIKFRTTFKQFTRKTPQNASLNHKYSCEYGEVNILKNCDFVEECEEVYDITTETGHFICNGIVSHNCWANDLTRLAKEGLFFLSGYNNQPPKHLSTFLDDVIEFVSFLSNRQSGAVGLPNVLIWAYYFWKKDVESGFVIKNPDYYKRQSFQKLIFRLNQPFLRIDQSAFTNISIFDRCYLEALFGGVEFPDGSFAIDNIEEIIDFQKSFMEVVAEVRAEQMFTFPVLTFSLLYKDGEFKDEEFARWSSDHNMKWYDSNFFISDNVGVLSNCCRLLSETTKLDAFVNSIGGTALSIGSCRVSTINLMRISYESKCNKKRYLDLLRERTLLNCKALDAMRIILKKNISKGLLPNYMEGAVELEKQYCTIGILGLFEVMDAFGLIKTDELGYKSYTDEALSFAQEIFAVINDVKDNFECDFTFNIESIPGENCAGVICNADNLIYDSDKYFIYSNQWIPLMEKCTIQEKCRVSSVLDKLCSGGAIAHINVENRFPTKDSAWQALNYVAEHGVIYSAFTTKINVCEHKHAFIGSSTCPVCGGEVTDQFSRVVGFYTPVSAYQKIRKREFNQRKWYNVLENDMVM